MKFCIFLIKRIYHSGNGNATPSYTKEDDVMIDVYTKALYQEGMYRDLEWCFYTYQCTAG